MSNNKLTCLVIEDEPDIQDWIVSKLDLFTEVEVLGTAMEIKEAYDLIKSKNPDFIFLDIKLIGGSAFQLINQLKEDEVPVPDIIIATAYQDFIFEIFNSYRENVIQFLMKPFVDNWYQQFRISINEVIKNKNSGLGKPILQQADYIFIPNKGNLIRLDFSKIIYLEVAGNGKSHVVLQGNTHEVDLTLNKFMELLPDNFFRISRHNIVNTNLIQNINKGDHTLSLVHNDETTNLGISDRYYNDLLLRLPMKRS